LIIIIGTAILFLLLTFFYLLFIQYSRRKVQHFKEVKELQTVYEQTLLQTQIEIQEQTFNYISEEIHDNIGQVLSLARLKLNTLGPDPSEEKINDVDEWLRKAIHDLRHLSHSLNTTLIKEKRIEAAIAGELEQFQKTGRYNTHFDCTVNTKQLDDNRSIILFRMIQEALNNIIKHAKATEIDIAVTETGETITFTITDNGIGFNTEEVLRKNNGAGLKNLFSRAKTITAYIDLQSTEGKGTTLSIHINKIIPYKKI